MESTNKRGAADNIETVVTPDQIKALRSKYAVRTQHNVFFNPRPGSLQCAQAGREFCHASFLGCVSVGCVGPKLHGNL